MSALKQRAFGFLQPEVPIAEDRPKNSTDKETATAAVTGSRSHETGDHSDDEISKDAQAGVQAIEAFTKVWTTSHIVIAYCTYVAFPGPKSFGNH